MEGSLGPRAATNKTKFPTQWHRGGPSEAAQQIIAILALVWAQYLWTGKTTIALRGRDELLDRAVRRDEQRFNSVKNVTIRIVVDEDTFFDVVFQPPTSTTTFDQEPGVPVFSINVYPVHDILIPRTGVASGSKAQGKKRR